MHGTVLFLVAWIAMAALLALIDGSVITFIGLLLVAKLILLVAAALDE